MTTQSQIDALRSAIQRSENYTERADCEFAGDVRELLVLVDAIYDGEVDHATENDGTVDVWGWTEEMDEGEMDWRLRVTLTHSTESIYPVAKI